MCIVESLFACDGAFAMSAPNPTAYGFAGFELKPRERAVMQAGRPIKLGGRALDMLLALIERRDARRQGRTLRPRLARPRGRGE